MPGDTTFATRQISSDEVLRYTTLSFRDAAGVHWERGPDGSLRERTPLPAIE